MSPSKHQEIISKARQLFDNGYSPSYIYEKLLKEGIGEDEAKATVEGLSNKPFVKAETVESGQGAVPMPEGSVPGGIKLGTFLIAGFVLVLIGAVLLFVLPENLRIIAYIVMLGGPVLMILGAFRGSS